MSDINKMAYIENELIENNDDIIDKTHNYYNETEDNENNDNENIL